MAIRSCSKAGFGDSTGCRPQAAERVLAAGLTDAGTGPFGLGTSLVPGIRSAWSSSALAVTCRIASCFATLCEQQATMEATMRRLSIALTALAVFICNPAAASGLPQPSCQSGGAIPGGRHCRCRWPCGGEGDVGHPGPTRHRREQGRRRRHRRGGVRRSRQAGRIYAARCKQRRRCQLSVPVQKSCRTIRRRISRRSMAYRSHH